IGIVNEGRTEERCSCLLGPYFVHGPLPAPQPDTHAIGRETLAQRCNCNRWKPAALLPTPEDRQPSGRYRKDHGSDEGSAFGATVPGREPDGAHAVLTPVVDRRCDAIGAELTMNAVAEIEVPEHVAGARDAVPDRRAYRMASIDILRGLVIVVMALDHVRDFIMIGSTQDPTSDPKAGVLLFMTRWVTHLCAPTFVFLSGVSAGLIAHRKSQTDLARFLLLRGLWLIALEVLVVSTAWSFSPMGIAELGGRTPIGLQVLGRLAPAWSYWLPRNIWGLERAWLSA